MLRGRRAIRTVERFGVTAFSAFAASFLFGAPLRADPMSTSPEQAYDLGEMPSARAVAMGGALNALGVSTAALYLNPANMALARVYHIEAFGAFSPESQRQTYGGAIVDSVLNTSRLAGGLGGSWSVMDPGRPTGRGPTCAPASRCRSATTSP